MSINIQSKIFHAPTEGMASARRTSLGKKIKKAKDRTYPVFASVPPGFSNAAFQEAKSKLLSVKNLHITKGGISFNADFENLIKSNLLLGIPSKILLRLGKFRVFNFTDLENEIEKIPFELFIFRNSVIKISASSRKSKLIHTGAVEEAVLKGVKQRLEQNCALDFPGHTQALIKIRISRDNAVVSMDSSGESLHKRGLKKLSCDAPIRENLAFAGLFSSGYTGDCLFFDPMCGSGTFSGEAFLIASNTPPGIFRSFAFENWPIYDQSLHNKIIEKEKSKIIKVKNKIFTSDSDCKNVLTARKNLLKTGTENISFFCSDFFDLKKQAGPGTIALNPPYGIRIEKEKKLLKKIRLKLINDFYGFNLILTIPKSFQDNYFSARNFDLIPFVHGGIEMNLLTGKIK